MSLVRLLTAGKSLIGLQAPKTRYHLHTQRPFPQFGSNRNPFRTTTRPEQTQASGVQSGRNLQQPLLTPTPSPSEGDKGSGLPGNGDARSGEGASRKRLSGRRLAASEKLLPEKIVSDGRQQPLTPTLSPPLGERGNSPPAVSRIQAETDAGPNAPATHTKANISPAPNIQAPKPRPVSRLGEWFGWRPSRATRAVGKLSGKALVQGELSLDRVRVVRNDLTDSDLEVVSVRRAGKPETAASTAEPATGASTRTPEAAEALAGARLAATAWSRMAGRLMRAGKS